MWVILKKNKSDVACDPWDPGRRELDAERDASEDRRAAGIGAGGGAARESRDRGAGIGRGWRWRWPGRCDAGACGGDRESRAGGSRWQRCARIGLDDRVPRTGIKRLARAQSCNQTPRQKQAESRALSSLFHTLHSHNSRPFLHIFLLTLHLPHTLVAYKVGVINILPWTFLNPDNTFQAIPLVLGFLFTCHPSFFLTTNMLPSIIILAVSLSSSLAAVPPRSDDTLHIPIRRRSNVRRQDPGVHRYAAAASALRHKYGIDPSPHERRAQTTDIGITNQVCAPSTTDHGVRLTICNPTRARIQVTLHKSTSAHRECETL